jgi:putative oxidoreductase
MMKHGILSSYGPLVARILLAAVFILAGIGKITGFSGTVAYIDSTGLPLASTLAVISIIVEIGAGVLIIIGWQGRMAAWALFVFVGLANIFFHTNFSDQIQMTMFLKNLAIMGGLLLVALGGTGACSIGCKCKGKYCLDCRIDGSQNNNE